MQAPFRKLAFSIETLSSEDLDSSTTLRNILPNQNLYFSQN